MEDFNDDAYISRARARGAGRLHPRPQGPRHPGLGRRSAGRDSSTATAATDVTATVGEPTTGDDPDLTTGDTDTSGAAGYEEDLGITAAFDLTTAGWPVDPLNPSKRVFDVTCAVDDVSVVDDALATALSCEVDGVGRPATLTFAAAPASSPAWGAGDAVRLVVVDDPSPGFGDPSFTAELRAAADDALLIRKIDATLDGELAGSFTPLAIELARVCEGELAPLRVDLTAPGQPTVSIFPRHRGLVPLSAEAAFVVDVAEARFSPHGQDMRVLMYRVTPGE